MSFYFDLHLTMIEREWPILRVYKPLQSQWEMLAKEGIKELKTFPLLIAAPFAPTPIDFASPYIYIIFSNKTKKILKNTYRYTTMIEDFLCQCTHVYPLHPVQEILLILWQVSFFCYYHVFIRILLVKLQRS